MSEPFESPPPNEKTPSDGKRFLAAHQNLSGPVRLPERPPRSRAALIAVAGLSLLASVLAGVVVYVAASQPETDESDLPVTLAPPPTATPSSQTDDLPPSLHVAVDPQVTAALSEIRSAVTQCFAGWETMRFRIAVDVDAQGAVSVREVTPSEVTPCVVVALVAHSFPSLHGEHLVLAVDEPAGGPAVP